MKAATILLVSFAAVMPVILTVAQDYEDVEDNVDGNQDISDPDSEVRGETRILGAAPAFGLGLLGGAVGSSLVRGVRNFFGARSQTPFGPALAPAFYPLPAYMPAGYPYPPFPSLPLRSFGPGEPGAPGFEGNIRKPYVPKLKPHVSYVPGPVIGFYRSEDSEDSENESQDFYENESSSTLQR